MMRTARALVGFLAGVAMLFSGMNVATADPRGNNGDVKIHDADTPQADHRNEPHVCRFYIDGFNFDVGQSGTWAIAGQPPTAGNAGTSGSWGPADSAGNWRTGVMTLADGHYKLDVNTGMGDGKHKVFWVECPGTETPSANQGQQQNGQNQQQNNQNKQQQNAPANVTGSQSKQKGSKTGTGSKSKARGSMTGTGSASKAKATNTGTQSKSKEAGAVSPAATTPTQRRPRPHRPRPHRPRPHPARRPDSRARRPTWGRRTRPNPVLRPACRPVPRRASRAFRARARPPVTAASGLSRRSRWPDSERQRSAGVTTADSPYTRSHRRRSPERGSFFLGMSPA
jgi:hypothetical protein